MKDKSLVKPAGSFEVRVKNIVSGGYRIDQYRPEGVETNRIIMKEGKIYQKTL